MKKFGERVIVYNMITGEVARVEGVDAAEYVATGGWSYSPPEIIEPKEDKKKTGRQPKKGE